MATVECPIRDQSLELFLNQDRKCALTGVNILLDYKSGEPRSTITVSLDRIDSSLPYTPDNVQWVHKLVNLMKRELHQNEFIDWCHKVTNHTEKRTTCC